MALETEDADARIDALLALVNALTNQVTDLEDVYKEPTRRNLLLYVDDNDFDTGDSSWLLGATSLVLFMTLPGLALYYAGMVRVTNVLATVIQVLSIACLICFVWMVLGYSLAFAPANPGVDGNAVFGDGSRIWFRGMSRHTSHQIAPTVPEPIFCAYQLTFAIITPALIAGSFADRMKYFPMLLFVLLWHLVVYCPLAHSFWHPDGFLFKAGSLDFAGGNVVHISSGISGLISAFVLGHRKGFGLNVFEPHNIVFSCMGACMLWVGWFGFNAGSAYRADGRASMALLVTHISAAVTSITWSAVEWIQRGKPSVLGAVSGAVGGLVCVTPGAGFINPNGAFFIGLIGGPLCYFGCQLKHYFGFDDALDSFGVHAVGGVIGVIATAFFATADVGGYDGIFYADDTHGWHRLSKQLYGMMITIVWSGVMTYFILTGIDKTIGLRVSAEDEKTGLDKALHDTALHDSNHDRRQSFDSLPRSTVNSPDHAVSSPGGLSDRSGMSSLELSSIGIRTPAGDDRAEL